MNLDIVENISKIGSEAWNKLNINDHPFTNYDFLYALEESKSVCAETGWLMVGARPGLVKTATDPPGAAPLSREKRDITNQVSHNDPMIT